MLTDSAHISYRKPVNQSTTCRSRNYELPRKLLSIHFLILNNHQNKKELPKLS